MAAGNAQPSGTRRTKSWTGNGDVNGQQDVREALPCPYPAVCPCAALCAVFPQPVASVSLPAPKAAVSRPVSRLCGEDWRTPESLGHRSYGGRKRCRIKRGGHKCPPAPRTPPRNAGRGTFPAGVTFLPWGSLRGLRSPVSTAAAGVLRVPGGDYL